MVSLPLTETMDIRAVMDEKNGRKIENRVRVTTWTSHTAVNFLPKCVPCIYTCFSRRTTADTDCAWAPYKSSWFSRTMGGVRKKRHFHIHAQWLSVCSLAAYISHTIPYFLDSRSTISCISFFVWILTNICYDSKNHLISTRPKGSPFLLASWPRGATRCRFGLIQLSEYPCNNFRTVTTLLKGLWYTLWCHAPERPRSKLSWTPIGSVSSLIWIILLPTHTHSCVFYTRCLLYLVNLSMDLSIPWPRCSLTLPPTVTLTRILLAVLVSF